MKRKSLLTKSLTLGLAVATAAASMSTPGGLVVPVTAYAQTGNPTAEKTQLTSDNVSTYLKLADNLAIISSRKNATVDVGYQEGYSQATVGTVTYTFKSADGQHDVNANALIVGNPYKVFVNVDGNGSALSAAATPVELGTVTAYTGVGIDITLTYKNGAGDGQGVSDLDGMTFSDNVTIDAGSNNTIGTQVDSLAATATINKPDADGDKKVVLFVRQPDGTTYAKRVTLHFDVTNPTLSALGASDVTAVNATSVTVNVTSSEIGRVHYLAKKTSEAGTAPDASAVRDERKPTTSIDKTGTPIAVTLNGLEKNTAYTIYFVAEDGAGNLSAVESVAVTTDKEALTGSAQLNEKNRYVNDMLEASAKDSNGSSFTYKWYKIAVKEGEDQTPVLIQNEAGSSYTVKAGDVGYKIQVVMEDSNFSGSLKAKTTAVIGLKPSTVDLGEAETLFGQVTGNAGNKTLSVTIPQDARVSQIEYSVDSGITWTDLTFDKASGAASISLENKAYGTNTIQVRVKQDDENGIAASESVKYADSIRATLAVTAKDISIDGILKYGQEITAKVTIEDAALKYQFYYVKDDQANKIGNASDSTTLTLNGAEYIGAKSKVTVTADGYDGAAEFTTTATVAKADARPVADPSIASKEQKDKTYTYTLTALGGAGAKYAAVDGAYKTIEEATADKKQINWEDNAAFSGLEPSKTYTFFVTYDHNDIGYEQSEIKYLNVTVDKLRHEVLKLNVAVEDAASESKKVTITAVDGAEYSFAGDVDGEYKSGASDNEHTFTKEEIAANSIITVAIRYKSDDKYETVAPLTQTIDLRKEIQEAPNAAGVTFSLNADKTKYVPQITEPDNLGDATAEYSLDGQTFKAKAEIEKKEFRANETIHLYVRKAADDNKNTSSAVPVTVTTNDASTAPGIAGKDGATVFKDTLEVTLEASAGSDIY
ncbi:MAG: hypothetical protein ACOCNL_05900, partial [Acetivibrio ethanolgignens]